MFIYASLTRVLSNSVGKIFLISAERLIARGVRLFHQYTAVSRVRGPVFSLGMMAAGVGVSSEYRYCQQEQICYNFNIFKCWNLNCHFYHVCKRCWSVQGISKLHGSNDIAKCNNMTPNYQASLERSGCGVAPPNYYLNHNKGNERLDPSSNEEASENERSDHVSETRQLDRGEQPLRLANPRNIESQSQQLDRGDNLLGSTQPLSTPKEDGDSYRQSLEKEVGRLRVELRKEKDGAESLIKEISDLRRKLEEKEVLENENLELRRQLEEKEESARGKLEEREVLLKENLELRRQLQEKEESARGKLEEKEVLLKENLELRRQLEEKENSAPKLRIMEPYSRLKLVTNIPEGFDSWKNNIQSTQVKISAGPNLGCVTGPPLFEPSRGQENSSPFILHGLSNGSGPSQEKEVNVFGVNTEKEFDPFWFR